MTSSVESTGTRDDGAPRFCVSARRMRPLKIVDLFEQAGKIHQLDSVFAFLRESPLNGGRDRHSSVQFPIDEIEELNRRGVGYSFTLTNLVAAPWHLDDPWTNEVLERFEDPMNSVIVATPLVADYIQKKYPGYRLRASCMFDFKTPDELNEACKRFDMVTPWPEINSHDDQLGALEQKSKILLFGSHLCLRRCGNRSLRHYYFWSLDHIAYYNRREYGVPYCARASRWHRRAPCVAEQMQDEIEDFTRLGHLGFSHFKVVQVPLFAETYLGLQRGPIATFWEHARRRISGNPIRGRQSPKAKAAPPSAATH